MSSGLQFLPRAEIDREKWNAFADTSDEAWFWHRTEFIDARSLCFRMIDISFGVIDTQNDLLAIVPLYFVPGVPYARRRSSLRWLWSQGGPAVVGAERPNLRRKVIGELSAHLRELIDTHKAKHLEARVSPLTPYLNGPRAVRANPLFHLGFQNASAATWMIDVTLPPDEIRRRYSENTRQSLKKASRMTFALREAAGGRDLEAYYQLHLETTTRKGAVPEPFEYYQRIFEDILPKKFARIVFFEQDGEVVATNNCVFYKRGGYYWTGASRSEKHDYEGRVLLDDQIVHASMSGCLQFEAGEAYISGRDAELALGSSEFKRSFGSEMVDFYMGLIRTEKEARWRSFAARLLSRVLPR